jgi:type VI secretion system protein ImpB
MSESLQHKLDRVRKPRVHITYDVEVGNAIQLKELPFVVGVMGDYSGKPVEALPRIKDRKFTEIDRDNFNQVLAGAKPRLAFQVDNKLDPTSGTKMNVELKFGNMDDFEPEQVVKQVEPLAKLLETRNKLKELLNKMDGNDKLESMLADVLENADLRKKLAEEAGAGGGESKQEGSQ